MNLKKPVKSGTSKYAGIVVPAIVIWLMICIGGVLITAYLINAKIIPLEMSGYGVVLTLLISSFVASAVAISKAGEKRLLVAGVCALGIIVVLTLCNVLFLGGGIHGFFVTALVVLAGCMAAVLVKTKPKKRRRFIAGKY